MIQSRKPITIALLFGASGLLASLGEDHHHDVAPPAPAERRTRVGVDELAAILNQEKAATHHVAPVMPPLPAGVEELSFQEFYKMPVGPRGLEPSDKLLSLNGKRVRIAGFMGEMERANKRHVIFSPVPLKPQPEEYGLCDDIPGIHVLVTVPGNPDETVPFNPQPLLLTGILSVGVYSHEGETSFVRMLLDPPSEKQPSANDSHLSH